MKIVEVFVYLCTTYIGYVYSAQPTGCTYDSTDASTGIYTCTFGSYTAPLTFTGFTDPYPQRLIINAVSGTLPTNTFSGFSSFAANLIDLDYAASLQVICSSGGTLTISQALFSSMSYLQELKISNCDIQSLPSSVFSNLVTLNSLWIEGGSMNTLASNILTGLSIEKLDVPVPTAEFVIKNTVVSGNQIPVGMLDGQTLVKSIRFDNIGLTSVDDALFAQNTALTSLSLADNAGITKIETALISTLEGLSSLDLDGIPFECTCDNLWILTHATTNGIALPSGIICGTPAEYQNKKASKYYDEMCDTANACGDLPGITLGPTICMTIIEIVSYCILAVTMVIAIVALVIICYVRRKLVIAKENLEKKRNSSWARVQNALKKGGASGQKPPLRSSQVDGWV
ncbi:Hypothetical predicted protein [Mytilus galloprovincialis]|uniref:LRRCT domain-containing protein n=1 Tax=Mytilus galloprovincialis TaxID=29158 RepID=A0A8B6ES48_MYTGA|nr:Hypothetical predicted protein [Mytilus galloprovincialis]